jgi:hypothetical protein
MHQSYRSGKGSDTNLPKASSTKGGLDRLRQALRVALHQSRVAQGSGYGRHVEDALVEVEDTIADQLAAIENAVDDDRAEADETGEAERERRSWFPRYWAA